MRPSPSLSLRNLTLLLLVLALAVAQALIGGARLAYLLPACALVALAGLAAFRVSPAPETRRPSFWCLFSGLALGIYVCVRSTQAEVAYLARPDFLTAAAALVIYTVMALHLTSARDRFVVIAGLLAVAFFHVLAGASQFRSGSDPMMLPWIVRPAQYYSRASGFYISPDHLAGFLEMLAVLALAICCWTHSRFATYVLAAYGVATCLVGIAISGSLAGNLSVVVAIGIVAMISLWVVRLLFPKRLLPAVAAAAVFVATVAVASLSFSSGEERLNAPAEATAEKRDFDAALNAVAWQIHQEKPLFGSGSGSFLYEARRLRPAEMPGDPVHAPSDYLEFLAEYGIVGAGLAALFLVTHLCSGIAGLLRIVRERRRETKPKRSRELAVVVGALGAFAALLIHAATDFSLHLPANALVAAFLFGMLASPGRGMLRRSRVDSVPPPAPWTRWIAPALSVVLLGAAVPRMRAEILAERARLALRDGQYREARERAELALRSERKNPDLFYYHGEASHYLGLEQGDRDTRFQRYTEAAAAFDEGLRLFPQDTRLLLKMGRTLDNLGRFDEATSYFDRALAADPRLGTIPAHYAVHWQMQGQFEKARELYQQAQALGETTLSTIGLADLEKRRDQPFRRSPRPDILADFISEPAVVAPVEMSAAPDP